MPASEADSITDEEAFHNSYYYYVEALGILADTAENQCQRVGDYNVAWELKDDVAAGKYLVSRGHLSASQEAWVGALSAALEAVNTNALPSGPGRETNLQAMANVSWEPIRFLAAEVIKQLEPFTAVNSSYLKLGGDAV